MLEKNKPPWVFNRGFTVVKEMRQHQLIVMKDSYNNDVIIFFLGRGKFDVFKRMSLSLSGESVNVAVILN